MKISDFHYSVRLPFATRVANPEWLGIKFLNTLDALRQVDSNVFPDWEIGDLPAMKGYPLAVVRSRIAEIINHNINRYDRDLPKAEARYTAVARTTIPAAWRQMTLWVRPWMDDVCLEAGDVMVPPDPAIVTYPLFRAALLAINAIWQQPWACVQAYRSRDEKIPTGREGGYRFKSLPMIPEDPTFPESIFHIPWFAYLSASLAVGVKLPPEIQCETTPDGGLLLTTTEKRLDPDIPEHARRARILAETLIAQTGYTLRGKKTSVS